MIYNIIFRLYTSKYKEKVNISLVLFSTRKNNKSSFLYKIIYNIKNKNNKLFISYY